MKSKLFFFVTIIIPLYSSYHEALLLNKENGKVSSQNSYNQMPQFNIKIPSFEPGFWATIYDKYNDLKCWLGYKTTDVRWKNLIVHFQDAPYKISDSLCTFIQGAHYSPLIEIKENGEKHIIAFNPEVIHKELSTEIDDKRMLYASLMNGWTVPGDGLGRLYIQAIKDLKEKNCDEDYYINSVATDAQRDHLLIKFEPIFYNKKNNWCVRVYTNRDNKNPLQLLCLLYKIKTKEGLLFPEAMLSEKKQKSSQ